MSQKQTRSQIVQILKMESEHSLDDIRWIMEANELGSVFGNATMISNPGEVCRGQQFTCDQEFMPFLGIHVKDVIVMDSGHFFFHRSSLKISCENPHSSLLAFEQLISVFDAFTWLGIIFMHIETAVFSSFILAYHDNNRKAPGWNEGTS